VPDALVALVCAAVVAGLCAAGPAVIARLPEPDEEADNEADTEVGKREATPTTDAEGTGSDDGPVARPTVDEASTAADPADADGETAAKAPVAKIPYAELATRPRLGIKLAGVGALVGLVVGWVLADEPIVGAWVALGAVGTVLGYVDAQTRKLPTRIIAPSYAVLVLLTLVAAWIDGETDDLVRAGLGWLVFGGFYFVLWYVYPKGLGYGDVRLSGLLGITLGYLGWGPVLVGIYAGFLLGGIGGGLLALLRFVDRKRYPFGPFMLAGALVGLVWGAPFADWYPGY
jgi:leader peptidase (prepilin peptidase) / N-methyltransferase